MRPRKFWGFRESPVGSNLGPSSYAYGTGLYEPVKYGNEFYFSVMICLVQKSGRKGEGFLWRGG
jgi:hypothetical protein